MSKNYTSDKKKELSLYLHIPFCIQKCEYCDFLSMKADDKLKERYVQALMEEIISYRAFAKDYVVKTIFFGGGTPSCLKDSYITKIMQTLYHIFTIQCLHEKVNYQENYQEQGTSVNTYYDKSSLTKAHQETKDFVIKNPDKLRKQTEITIESNPGTLNAEKLQSYLNTGINRISLGLQSTENEELKILGRIHTYQEFEENYNLARNLGFSNINIDLMSALPGQSVDSWRRTLERIIALEPEHISAYSLIIEEGTPFHEKYSEPKSKTQYALPTEEEDREMYRLTKKLLADAGYHRYEISNYAKEGYECSHNTVYWTAGEYLGIGLGASSLIQNTRFHNEENLETYISMPKTICNLRKDIIILNQYRQMEEYMFLGLRRMEGISKKCFEKRFLISADTIYGTVLNNLVRDGLMVIKEDNIALTEQGIDLSNYVFAEFLLEEE